MLYIRSIYLLLFADDSALLSDTTTGLQQLLYVTEFEKYCDKWNLKRSGTSELTERLHRKFLRKLITVKTTTNSAIYGEFGRYPLHINKNV